MAMIKKAYSLFKISKFSESQALFDTTVSKLHKYRPDIEESFFLESARAIYEYRYSMNYASGDYIKALQFIDSVISFNKEINETWSHA